MGVSDTLNYVLFSNPVSSNAGSFAKTVASAVIIINNYSGVQPRVEYKLVPPEPLWKSAAASGPYLKLAGLSGFFLFFQSSGKYKDDQLKQVFETANRYHFYHSLAMVGLVTCRAPTAALWMSGFLMFCGSCYYYTFTGDKRSSKITPFGGTCCILGWLTMCI
ncbi:transmembrane protein 256 homolog [Fopius arisanus]|uniref:Transmembrane protein 256 homolog n=1 Tax=Fopius arisanus TaxID=64838 RepID=A0A9R1UC32_9HYME|nr:PREDICTED: transmembrane protein 256 homolog [Fopius arisanus]